MSGDSAPAAPVLLTGASGQLGRVLAAELAGRGWHLRLTDIVPFPGPLPRQAQFTLADLGDAAAIPALAAGCGAILHFGGISTEAAFDSLLAANITGAAAVYAAARAQNCRVVFASSNHAFGFHPRTAALNAACTMRPDSLYGLSKAYGELLAQLNWDKHGVESVLIRIGSCFPKPRNDRMLSTWLSYADLVRLVVAAVLAPQTGCAVIWGASANPRSWWGGDDRDRIGWAPEDSAEPFAAECAGVETNDALAQRYQGGSMCRRGYDRDAA